ncbi:MAG: serine--tRNA ligase, partial [Coriobacteriales bacterium]
MLDAKFVRENLDLVTEAMKNRNFDAWDPQAFTDLDVKRRELISSVEGLQAKRNSSSKEIGKLMSQGEKDAAEAKKAEVKEVNAKIESYSAELDKVEEELNKIL